MSQLFTVFYCWQSDTPERHGRYLILEALNLAAVQLSRDSEVEFQLYVDEGTRGETGLCDIPNTILRKISSADAVVADLTFVAKSAKDKHCPNPNVLFELGYAFHSVGPERLILVANEKHGEVKNQIFDLQHRRFPITFESAPNSPGNKREKAVATLSKKLAEAIKAMMMRLGLRSAQSGDDAILFEREVVELRSSCSNKMLSTPGPKLELIFHPERYEQNRWADVSDLESFVRMNAGFRIRRDAYPENEVGTKRLNLGIFNDTHGVSWALTYSGLFWLYWPLSSSGEINLTSRELSATWPREERKTLKEGDFLFADLRINQLAKYFRFLRRLTTAYRKSEQVRWRLHVDNIQSKWINFHNDWQETYGPCAERQFIRTGSDSAESFSESTQETVVEVMKAFFDLFTLDGREITREDLTQYVVDANG